MAISNSTLLKNHQLLILDSKISAFSSWNELLPEVSVGFSLSRSNLTDKERTKTIEYLLPDFSSSTDTGYSQVIPVYYDITSPRWRSSADFTLNWNFHVSSIISMYKRISEVSERQLEYAIDEYKIIRDITLLYCDAVFLSEQLRNLRKSADEYRDLLYLQNEANSLDSLYSYISGIISDVIEIIENEYSMKENDYQMLMQTIAFLCGITEEIELTDAVEYFINVSSRKDTQNYHSQLQKMHLNKLSAGIVNGYLQFVPYFSIFYLIDPSYSGNLETSNMFNSIPDLWPQNTGSVTFTFKVPLTGIVPFSDEQNSIIRMTSSYKALLTQIESDSRSYLFETSLRYKKNMSLEKHLVRLKNALSQSDKHLEDVKRAGQINIADARDILYALDNRYRMIHEFTGLQYKLAILKVELDYFQKNGTAAL